MMRPKLKSEMCPFQLEMREMHKTADFHSNLLVSWELGTKDYPERPMKRVNFKILARHGNSLVILLYCSVSTGAREVATMSPTHLPYHVPA